MATNRSSDAVAPGGWCRAVCGSLSAPTTPRWKRLRHLEVDLHRRHLPAPPDRVADVDVDLRGRKTLPRPRQRGTGRPAAPWRPCRASVARSHSSTVPRNFFGRVESSASNSVSPNGAGAFSTNASRLAQLALQLVTGAENMSVVLGDAPHPERAVQDARALVAVDRPELEEPQREFPVERGGSVYEDVHRAVHRLGVVRRALQLHRRVHARRRTSRGGRRSRTAVDFVICGM